MYKVRCRVPTICPSRCYSTQRNWTFNSQRLLFENIARKLQITSHEDWCRVTQTNLIHAGGGIVLKQHNSSIFETLKAIYPEITWYPWQFKNETTPEFWKELANQKLFFDWFGEKFNLQTPEDWYEVTKDEIIENGGKLLLQQYDGSLPAALRQVYPQHRWPEWYFSGHVPEGYWDDERNVTLFVDHLVQRYDLQNNDVSLLTVENISDTGGSTLLKKCGGIQNLLQKYFPESRVARPSNFRKRLRLSKGQQMLLNAVRSLLPSETIVENHLLSRGEFRPFEIDIFLPRLSLGLEYQGQYHFQHSFIFGSPEVVQKRDEAKKALCADMGITLIEVPFWWDRSIATVAATIHKYRPDIIPEPPAGSRPVSMDVMPQQAATTIELQNKKTIIAESLPYFSIWNRDQNPTGKWLIKCPIGTRVCYRRGSLVDMQGSQLNTSLKLDIPPTVELEGVLCKEDGQERLHVIDTQLELNYHDRLATLAARKLGNVTLLQGEQCTSQAHFEETVVQCIKEGKLLLLMNADTGYNVRQHSSFVVEETLPEAFDRAEWVTHRRPYVITLSRGNAKCFACKTRP